MLSLINLEYFFRSRKIFFSSILKGQHRPVNTLDLEQYELHGWFALLIKKQRASEFELFVQGFLGSQYRGRPLLSVHCNAFL
jgi:hypothetical protein